MMNVSELQVEVMQLELTPVEHESKFIEFVPESAAMRAMLPRDMLERFLDGHFNHAELRIPVSAYVGGGGKLAGQEAINGAQPMDSGQLDNPNEGDEDVTAVQRHQRQRPNLKSRSESDRERTNRQTGFPTPPAPCQKNPRDRKPGNEDTKQSALKKTRLL